MMSLDECQCPYPIIVCGANGCRCHICGGLQRIDLPMPQQETEELKNHPMPDDVNNAALSDLRAAIEDVERRITAENQRGSEVERFAEAVLHGSEEHRAWLREAARCWKQGLPLPKPRD